MRALHTLFFRTIINRTDCVTSKEGKEGKALQTESKGVTSGRSGSLAVLLSFSTMYSGAGSRQILIYRYLTTPCSGVNYQL